MAVLFGTDITCAHIHRAMDFHVNFQVMLSAEPLVAQVAGIFHPVVHSLVQYEMVFLGKLLVANVAPERAFPSVQTFVLHQVVALVKPFVAHVTLVRPFTGMQSFVAH